jgi:hypothetical protein
METRTTPNDHSLPSLLRELRDETTTLVRQEVALAKAEMSEKASKLGRNAAFMAIGGIVLYTGLIFVLLAFRDLLMSGLVNAGVTLGTATWLSSIIIGLIVAIIGAALLAKGKKAISQEGLAPEKTIETLREDQQWAKQRLKRA